MMLFWRRKPKVRRRYFCVEGDTIDLIRSIQKQFRCKDMAHTLRRIIALAKFASECADDYEVVTFKLPDGSTKTLRLDQ